MKNFGKRAMGEREMFEMSFQRPSNFFQLTGEEQWDIDESLGILDWGGDDLSKEDIERFENHYKSKSAKIQIYSIIARYERIRRRKKEFTR